MASFGDIHLVQYKATGQHFALKTVLLRQIDKRKLLQAGRKDTLQREISLLSSLSHTHLLRLFHHFEDPSTVYLALELAAKGSLLQAIHACQHLTESQVRHYFLQTCTGLRYLHYMSLIHRAIRPRNLLIDHCDNIKISGLSSCVHRSEAANAYCESLNYTAPEVLRGGKPSLAVDIWGLGVCLYEMMHGCEPFEGNEIEKRTKIIAGEWTMDPDLSPLLKDLLKALLRTNPEERPDIDTVLEHPWVQDSGETRHYDAENSADSSSFSSQSGDMSQSGVGLELESPKQVPFPTAEQSYISSQERRDSAVKVRGWGVLQSGHATDEEFFRTVTQISEITPRCSISVPSLVPSLEPIPAKDLDESSSPTFSIDHLLCAVPVDAREKQAEEEHTNELEAQFSVCEEEEQETEQPVESSVNPYPRITPAGLFLRHHTMDLLLNDPDVRHSFRRNPTKRHVEENAFLRWIGSFMGCTDRY